MAKRHTDTIQFDQQWFQTLHPTHKCFWFYICAKCNHAGIWDVNLPLAKFSIDPNGDTGVEFDKLLEIFNGRIVDLGKDKWYLPKYVLFHHGEILYPNNNFHISIIKSLEKHYLIDEDKDGNYIVRTMPNSSAKPKPRANTPAKRFKSPDIEECIAYFKEKKFKNAKEEAEKFWNFYESKGWMVGKNKMKNWHSAATNWNKSNEADNKKKRSRTHIQEGHLEKAKEYGW
jgi:hypothetical protein